MTIHLPAGQTLTITADALSTGNVGRKTDSPGDAVVYDPTDIAASSTTTIGPFTTERVYEIITLTGSLAYTVAVTDLGTTGTGSRVHATAPTLTAAVVTPAVTIVSADGALAITSGIVKITKSASAAALTLAAPTADQEGTLLQIVSTTAKAHVITATGLLDDGITGGSKNTATFAAFAGAAITLVAIGLKWSVLSKNVVTVA